MEERDMSVRVGKPAPSLDFEAYVPTEAQPWRASLEELRGSWVVLVFYPRDLTSAQPTELSKLAQLHPQFEAEEALVLAASTDTFRSHKDWFETHPSLTGVFYPVIADTAHELSNAFGVLTGDGAALRGTFVIDPECVVRYASVTDRDLGHSLDETLRVLRALRTASSAAPSEPRPA
jgi:alkyl hydroperoxide reductase subunit AhpC